ncbi:MAG TPA: GMC family oxidoreductase [Myxococcota bacterium]|jgi:choline dehydrogenase-like flavoprotein|nr:GMC family oxidoreductase [Myxococcota bacterium]
MSSDRYDVIIIGTGAGGGTLARALAPSGKRILLLERGPWLPRERENWDSGEVVTRGRYDCGEEWTDGDGRRFEPGIHYFVGGNTKFYGGAMYRMRERDFEELKHHGGVSPGWPVAYDELEPFYAEAERWYHVHGDAGADPTEPRRSGPFPHPPVSHEPRIQELHEDFVSIGRRPFHNPVAIQLDERDPVRSRCVRCGTCDGFPCLVRAKGDAEVCGVLPALEHPNVEIETSAKVLRLETSVSGREVTGVVIARDGGKEVRRADLVVVSCGAINSAALLLRSANERHPTGLANGSGQLGRNLMIHNNSALAAISRRPNPTRFQKTIAISDFYFGDDAFPFPMGLIQMWRTDANIIQLGAPPFAPRFSLEYIAKHVLDFWVTSEDLPDPENRVTLDAEGGIRLGYRENNLEGHRRLVKRTRELLEQIGMETHHVPRSMYIHKKLPLANCAHQCGTVRFGADPASSVLDRHCRAHEVDNLYVVDGSFFPSSAAVNPALTIVANALRVGAHLRERLGA